ncbi:uncharacterized protein LOC100203182 [Hydra vulgaris]|uniref:Uncharacterized protein LOC100203182 n=1 Tax=Hydra vulgaris TaxID=6087 RepID=A0ABM4C3J4_HYDVU
MKIAVIIASLSLLCCTLSAPVQQDDCELLFSKALCSSYNSIDDGLMNDDSLEASDVDEATQEFLRNALKAKLDFLINLGLLQRIPLIGQAIHDFVAADPQGVADALKGGIFGAISIGQKILQRIFQG